MISDDSSSDSETGRFKGTSQKKDDEPGREQRHSGVRQRQDKPSDDRRFNRDFNRRDDRNRSRFSRQSPDHRRRLSRDRSSERRRRSVDRQPRRDIRSGSYSRRDSRRSNSREKRRGSHSRSKRLTECKRSFKDEKTSADDVVKVLTLVETNKKSERNISPIDFKKSKSQVVIPSSEVRKRKSTSPIIEENAKDKVVPGSYYNMIPVVKEASENSSVTDSSDDERLRAKLLNLEKELDKTRKKKHKKKHRRRTSKSKTKERDRDGSNIVEVTSTTDIKENKKTDEDDDSILEIETAEVSSSQSKPNNKESSEEGEIVSDEDDTKIPLEDIDPTDLRHKLKRSSIRESSKSPDLREKLKLKNDICGPALPPHLESKFKKKSPESSLSPRASRVKGPTIPSEMRKILAETEPTVITFESSDEDVGIGPLPTSSKHKWTEAHQKLEERALDMKIKKLDGQTSHSSNVKEREEWMLELPEAKARFIGVEARSFRPKEGPDMTDRSSWTDTPEEKLKKAAGRPVQEDSKVVLERDARGKYIAERDAEQEQAARRHKKKHKRDESLLDLHQKKLKKKKKKEDKDDEKKERRPFSRDQDLQVNRFDEAQKKSIIKKAQNLDSRFSRGEAKYL